MTIHELKIKPEYFKAVLRKEKRFELRKDDRNYKVGDVLCLKEWDEGECTGDEMLWPVRYVLRNCPEYGLRDGYCILGL